MDALIASMSKANVGGLRVIAPNVEGEQNVCTKAQVDAVKEKGWTAFYWTGTDIEGEGSWQPYAGSDVPTGIGGLSADGQNGDWYTLDGKKLATEPKQPGIYIRNGRKVVK
ncbi:MAG: hypothetical protein IJ605_00705 [Prevotella sp.]|nr:hypothetical protein [Prevotella sp.]